MNFKMKLKSVFIFIFSVILFVSCISSKPDCISEYHDGMEITWGNFDAKNKKIEAYRIDDSGKLYYVVSDSLPNTFISEQILKVDFNNYCEIFNFVNKVTVQTQALYSPGEKSKFIDFKIPNTQVFSRAVWNPEFETVGSRRHRLLYDSLMTLVPIDHYKFNDIYRSLIGNKD